MNRRHSFVATALLLVAACGGDDDTTTGATTTPTTTASTTDETGSSGGTATTSMTTMSSNSGSSGSETVDTGSSSQASSESNASNEGSGSSSAESGASSGSESGGACAKEEQSCLDIPCCGTLECCSGQPIPPGEANCYPGRCPISDRNRKHGFLAVDGDRILDTVASMPITTWSYIDDPAEARHIGPMAQDFYEAFAVGDTDKRIFQVDADGVALASIQALSRRVTELQAERDELRERLGGVEARLAALEPARPARARSVSR